MTIKRLIALSLTVFSIQAEAQMTLPEGKWQTVGDGISIDFSQLKNVDWAIEMCKRASERFKSHPYYKYKLETEGASVFEKEVKNYSKVTVPADCEKSFESIFVSHTVRGTLNIYNPIQVAA